MLWSNGLNHRSALQAVEKIILPKRGFTEMQNKKILKKTLSYITALFIIGFLTYTGKQIHAMADTTVYFE